MYLDTNILWVLQMALDRICVLLNIILFVKTIYTFFCEMLELDNRYARSPSNVYDLIEYMKTEFGDVAHQKIRKPNRGWFLDQWLISILVSEWKSQHEPGRVRLIPWNTKAGRLVAMFWITSVN